MSERTVPAANTAAPSLPSYAPPAWGAPQPRIDVADLQARARRDVANKNLLVGALMLGGGITVTAVSLAAAGNGGTYVVAWGAIVFGAIRLIRGLATR